MTAAAPRPLKCREALREGAVMASRLSANLLGIALAIARCLSMVSVAEAVSCAGVAAWNGNGVPYSVGTNVVYNGARYTCSVAHTSVYNWDPVNYAQGWGWGTATYGAPCDSSTATATPT